MPSGGYECDWQKGFYPLKTPSLQIDFLPRFSYLVPPPEGRQNRLGAALQEGGELVQLLSLALADVRPPKLL